MEKTKISRVYRVLIPVLIISLISISCGDSGTTANSESYSYDDNGRLTQKILPSGDKVSFDYDSLGHLVGVDAPDLQVQVAYDERGNVILMADDTGRTEYIYDEFNRPVEVIYEHSPEKRVLYEYDPWDRVTSIAVSDETGVIVHRVDYEYDLFGNLLWVDDGAGRIEYSRDPLDGKIIRLMPNGVKSIFSFAPGGALSSIQHLDRASELIARYDYKYDVVGRVTQIEEVTLHGTGITRYEWDSRGYLDTLHLPDGQTIRYEYDAMGNRLTLKDNFNTIDYKYDGFGQLTRAGDSLYEYNRNGNMISINEQNRQLSLDYNSNHQLTNIQSLDGQISHQYKYDGLGSLTWSNNNGIATSYLPWSLDPRGFALAEYKTDRELYYTYGQSLLSCLDTQSGISYYLEDGFGSIRLATNMNGAIVGQRDYSPFGATTMAIGEMPGNFRSAGEIIVQDIGLHLINNKPYDARLARYLTTDMPFGLTTKVTAFAAKKVFGDFTGKVTGNLFNYMDPVSKWYARITYEGGPLWTWDDTEAFAHPLLKDVGTSLGLFYTGGNYWGGVAGGFLFGAVGVGVADLFTFYGTRMDRKENWLQWEKWISVEAYSELQHLNDLIRLANRVPGNTFEGSSGTELKFPLFPLADTQDPLLPVPVGPGPGPTPDFSNYDPPNFPPFGFAYAGVADSLVPYSPLPVAEEELGGISLGATMELEGDFDLGNIVGAVWDDENESLVLLGEKNTNLPSIKAADLAVALNCVMNSWREPMFSLESEDPKDPRGPYQKALYIGPIEDTHFGQVMFDADWRLKEYSFGVSRDENGQNQEIVSQVPGYKDTFDRSFEQDLPEGETFTRLWITCEDIPAFQKDGAIYFGPLEMKVNTEIMFLEEQGLTSSEGKQDPVSEAFAAHFTDHYDEFADEEPAFAEVRELAKAVALANWLIDTGIPVDLDWVDECLADAVVDTPDTVPTLNHEETRVYRETSGSVITTGTLTMWMIGGVDLSAKLRNAGEGEGLSELASKIKTGISSESPIFDVAHADKDLQAVVLPITTEGKRMWGQGGYIEQEGIKYFPADEKVARAVDENGNTAEFEYMPDGQLKEIKWTLDGGFEATARRSDGYDTLELNTPTGDRISYRYDTTGQLSEVSMNGETYARFTSSENILEVDYGQYMERYVSNDKGMVTSYQAGQVDAPDSMRTLRFTYDNLGNMAKVSGSEMGEMTFEYAGDKIAAVQMPLGRINYNFDAQNRLKEVVSSSGKSVAYSYEGDQLTQVLLKSGDQSASTTLADGLPIEYVDFSGARTTYQYTPEGMLSRVTDPQGATVDYIYSDTGHLLKANLPDGSLIEYEYNLKGQLMRWNIYPSEQ